MDKLLVYEGHVCISEKSDENKILWKCENYQNTKYKGLYVCKP